MFTVKPVIHALNVSNYARIQDSYIFPINFSLNIQYNNLFIIVCSLPYCFNLNQSSEI